MKRCAAAYRFFSSAHDKKNYARSTNNSRRTASQQPKNWEKETVALIKLHQWNPGHKRKAQQCFHHWSLNKIPQQKQSRVSSSHNNNKKMLVDLWSRIQLEAKEQETPPAIYDFAVHAMARNGLHNEALEIWEEFRSKTFLYQQANNRHTPNSFHFSAILHSLARSKQPAKAEKLLLSMFDEPNRIVEPNVFCVTNVLDGWSRSGQGQKAQDSLDICINKYSLEPTIACYNAVLSAWSRDQAVDDAQEKATEFLGRIPVPKDAATWSSYLNACRRNPKDMERILWHAYQQGEPINVICFNVVLNAWVKKRQVQQAEDFLKRWIKLIKTDIDSLPRHLWPKLSTFNTLLDGLAKKGDTEKARHWLDEMQQMGVAPDHISYNSWIDSLAQAGKASEAQAEWETIYQNMDYRHNLYACTSVLSAWANYARQIENKEGIIETAFRFVDGMKEKGVQPTIVTYNSLLKVIAACEKPELAEKILIQMESGALVSSERADVVSYSCVIDAFAKAGDPEGAHEINKRLVASTSPNTVTFNSIIHAYSRSNDPAMAEKAESILQEMKSANVDCDLMTYCSVLTCWYQTKHPDKAARARLQLDSMMRNYPTLARKHHNSEELLRNAQTMVISACAYSRPDSKSSAQVLRIATKTYGEVQNPTHVTYATYILALHRLEQDPLKRENSIVEVFLRHCREGNQIEDLVVSRLKASTSAVLFKSLLASGTELQTRKKSP
mmetsp:Transcript_18586/g.27566  ORF Transcript_18586/g.27566 Transcript_18586/m.27566 type:complete len:725 (-) Transcript_18586:327-2501(-)|eukprot:CAMPEP_0194223218 /NCGR_PEP_ID=MMETSP0156-20130528/34631_1 /TAXON_ID=33649 /ORGANISM="Thalassionema nitzschioides, Strain L26-B" /LENGTH=724 /DNA_ID=CAMNT_0038954279 /DNA_START=132 /DNA_END=2306 /DNA_ORIENTATION=+